MKASPSSPAVRLAALFLLAALSPASPLAAATHTVQVQAGSFSPASLLVNVGDRVLWVNGSGAAHNVVSDDGTFASGEPSASAWSWGHYFPRAGVFSYYTQGLGNFSGTVTVTGIFGEGHEAGTLFAWDAFEPNSRCDCYFSGDCAGNGFCNWGILTQEDNCDWMENKPMGVPGAGCNVDFPGGVWQGGICDGVCEPPDAGSIPGAESPALIREAVGLWTAAILEPARRPGGGPMDPVATQKAMSLPFHHQESAVQTGRQVADLLMLSGVPEFYMYFCHWEADPGQPQPPSLWIDLSAQRCRADLAQLLADALIAEIGSPGAGAAVLASRPPSCAGSAATLGAERCPGGDLPCLSARVAGLAVYLTTPPASGSLRRALANPLRF